MNLLRSIVKWNLLYDAKTMFVSAICPSISQCFNLLYVVCLHVVIVHFTLHAQEIQEQNR